ncbi:MAG TPA: RNA polymerase sigma factor [Gemmatimonadaceae bacterium]|nr:RNA polymerase sigma factor [Gemmatimonadaceae bacterium]
MSPVDAVPAFEGTTQYMSEEQVVNDAVLVRRVLEAGDGGGEHAAAFTQLVDRHAPACLRFATRMLGTREDAEDATQETLMRAYRALHTFDESTPFRTWLFSILVNRCRTAILRRTRRERWISNGDHFEHASATSSPASLELKVELGRALEALPSDLREAFLLKHVEQLEYEEMAAITGRGVSALKMRVRRACARLRRELAELNHER